jgi:glycosyltransferase involved in cell wall biosynthesis
MAGGFWQRPSRYAAPTLATVLHYVQTWLPLSAGFVHAHVERSRHRAVVVARDPLEHRATFPHRPVLSLHRIQALGGGRRPSSAALAAIAVGSRARVVHVHFGYVVDDVLRVAGRLRLPVVLSLHGEDVTALPSRSPGHYAAAVDAAAAVIVPSRFLASSASALGFPDERVHVVPSGINTTFFRPTPIPGGAPSALFVGRLVEKKGVDVLLEAWPHVQARVPGATLRIIGDGPMRDRVREAADGIEHEAPDPARRREQVRDAIARATVVVQPSRTAADGDSESLLLVNLEAQASGRPVVSTLHGGIPEFVDDGRTGILVPEGDPVALADALARVLDDRALATRLAEAGPAWAAPFDVAACTARVDDLYDRLR